MWQVLCILSAAFGVFVPTDQNPRQRKRSAIAGGEQLVLAFIAAAPDRPDRMDDVPGFEPVTAGDLGGARVTAAEFLAFSLQVRSGPAVDRERLFGIEYFPAHSATPPAEVMRRYKARAEAETDATLNFVLRRIGRLCPDPGCIAVWSFPEYAALEGFERRRDDDDPLRPTAVGIYRWFGKEIL